MAKKKKVRVALKKNRQKRTRANDLTRTYESQGKAAEETAATERVRPKGDLSRHRTIVAEAGDATARVVNDDASAAETAAAQRVVDESTCLQGRVMRIHGLLSIVQTDDGRMLPCHVRRLLKSLAIEGRNVVTVGDRVWFRPASAGGEEGLIEKVEARRGVISAGLPAPPARHRRQCGRRAHRLGPGRARTQAQPDRSLPGRRRDRRSPAGHRVQQGRPGRLVPLPVGGRPLCSTRVRDHRHLGR